MDTQRFSIHLVLLNSSTRGAQLRFWQRTWCTNHAYKKRGYASCWHPTRVSTDLLSIACMQIKSAPSMSMHINKTWRDYSVCCIYDAASYSFLMSNRLY